MGDFVPLGPRSAPRCFRTSRCACCSSTKLDKSDLGLPNDVLHVLEDGSLRHSGAEAQLRGCDLRLHRRPGRPHESRSRSRGCREFPVVVITRNAECEFPLVFRRRFLPLELRLLLRERLLSIAASHLSGSEDVVGDLVDDFERRVQDGGTHSVDQLLKALRRATTGGVQPDADKLLNTLAPGAAPRHSSTSNRRTCATVRRCTRSARSSARPTRPWAAVRRRHRGPAASAPRTRRRHGSDARPQQHPASGDGTGPSGRGATPSSPTGFARTCSPPAPAPSWPASWTSPARAAQGRGPRPRCAPPCASRRTPRCRTPAVRAGRGCVVNSRCCAPCPDRSRYGLFVSSRGPQTASRTQGRTGCSKYTKGSAGEELVAASTDLLSHD